MGEREQKKGEKEKRREGSKTREEPTTRREGAYVEPNALKPLPCKGLGVTRRRDVRTITVYVRRTNLFKGHRRRKLPVSQGAGERRGAA